MNIKKTVLALSVLGASLTAGAQNLETKTTDINLLNKETKPLFFSQQEELIKNNISLKSRITLVINVFTKNNLTGFLEIDTKNISNNSVELIDTKKIFSDKNISAVAQEGAAREKYQDMTQFASSF